MVNAQEWLDQNYPKENRENVTELNIREKELEGDLDLNDFVNLTRLCCHGNKLTFLGIDKCIKLAGQLCCYDNQLTSLDVRKSKEINQLNSHNNKLTELDLSNNQKLTHLSLNNNKLSHLKLSSQHKELTNIWCNSNQLTNMVEILKQLPCPEKMIELGICNNNIPPQDLSMFSRFTNLEGLWLWGNPFYGSLKYLKNMTKLKTLSVGNSKVDSCLEYLPVNLEELWVSNTNIDSGLECLPPSLKKLGCENTKLAEELVPYGGDLQKWREANQDLLTAKNNPKSLLKNMEEQIKKNHQLLAENNSLQSQLSLKTNFLTESNTLIKLIEDSLTNGIGDGSINVTNGNALVGNTIKSLKLINDYVSNNTTHITLEGFSPTEIRLEAETKINQLEKWQQDLTTTNKKIQELLEKQEKVSLKEQLKNIQIQPKDQSEENKEKLELVTKSLGELKEMLSTLRGGVSVTNGSALIDNIIENLETINNYTTNNYNDYEEILKELKEKQKELEQLKTPSLKLLSSEEISQTNLATKKVELKETISQIKSKLEKSEQENQDYRQENNFTLLQVLLDSQETLTIYQNSPNITPLQIVYVEKQLQRVKKDLLKVLKEEELSIICQEQKEIVKLQLELETKRQIEAKIEITTK